MYLNGMGLRAIERVTDIHHTTVMHWIRAAGLSLPNAPEDEEIPEIPNWMNFRLLWATNATKFGFGLPLITGAQGFWLGW